MSFKNRPPVLLLVTLVVILNSYLTCGKPMTPINKLPRITTDTLYAAQPQDNMGSESIGFLRPMFAAAATNLFQNQIRPQRQEAGYVTLFRLPWRIARSVSETGFGMARSFMDTFAQQFMESYQHMQRNVIPQASTAASEAFAVWANPPKPKVAETSWLDGGV